MRKQTVAANVDNNLSAALRTARAQMRRIRSDLNILDPVQPQFSQKAEHKM